MQIGLILKYLRASWFFPVLAVCVGSLVPLPSLAQGKTPLPMAPAQTPQASLDKQFGRLKQAKSPEEAQSIITIIERLWLRSGSDTADVLMNRAMAAISIRNYELAGDVLDKIVELEPDWAEGWNKRATLRYLRDDDAGSVADIAHVLALEPRHFGALAGLGSIMQRNGYDKGALQAFRQLLAINPQQENIRKTIEKLVPEVEGREL